MAHEAAGRLGRVSIGSTGTIVSADAVFGATIRLSADALAGRNILDITAPADRERCIFLLARLIESGAPVATTKRLIRSDRTHIWVQSQLTLEPGDPVRVSIAIDRGAPPSDWVDPADLLRIARLMYDGRRARTMVFSPALFSDHAWDILLAAYISEASGRVLETADLETMIGISAISASRWMRALNADGLLEYEGAGDATLITSAFRLSSEGHRRFERFLSERYAVERAIAAEMALDCR